jgi:DNA-binding response OmpR family regulator
LEKSADFDCVILDYHMPHMDGMTAAMKMRERGDWKSIAIIMLTGDVHTVLNDSIDATLIKPFNIEKLLKAIDDATKKAAVRATGFCGLGVWACLVYRALSGNWGFPKSANCDSSWSEVNHGAKLSLDLHRRLIQCTKQQSPDSRGSGGGPDCGGLRLGFWLGLFHRSLPKSRSPAGRRDPLQVASVGPSQV